MNRHVWLLCRPEPARFSEEHTLWEKPVEVFSTRELALQHVADIADWLGVIVDWQRPNPFQHCLVADLGDDHVYMLTRIVVDDSLSRLRCMSGEHAYHRSRNEADRCRVKTERQHGRLILA
jgi:hypothetical protein